MAVMWALSLLLHEILQLLNEAFVSFFIVGFVLQDNVAVAVDGYAVFRIGQILRSEPEIERVFAHELKRPARRYRRGTRCERVRIELADERNVSHRIGPFF